MVSGSERGRDGWRPRDGMASQRWDGRRPRGGDTEKMEKAINRDKKRKKAKNGEKWRKMKKILAYVAKKCYLCGLNGNTGVYVGA